MHIHILGICGTFMAGIAAIAKEAGHTVTGCDKNVYPPMSDALAALDIDIHSGYDAEQLDTYQADIYIIGNAMTRGHEVVEAILAQKLPYTSGPDWLYQNVLRDKTVIAIAGTHGKTTTSSMVAWLLEAHGLEPGFLIGGMPENFAVSARLGNGSIFVIEADEYDTAFFDKRSKFVLYRPDILILNNLEFDHADIFNSLDDIKRQFHHLIRCVPENGEIIYNHNDENIIDVLNKGVWTNLTAFANQSFDKQLKDPTLNKRPSLAKPASQTWQLQSTDSKYRYIYPVNQKGEKLETNTDKPIASDQLPIGEHNQLNALAAILAANKVGVPVGNSIDYFKAFKMPKRRLEVLLEQEKIIIYRDFAHHPTAIKHTLKTLQQHYPDRTLIAVIEMRSNSMKQGVHDDAMTEAMDDASNCYVLASNDAQKSRLDSCLNMTKTTVFDDSTQLYQTLVSSVKDLKNTSTCVVFLTNGSFDNISEQLVKSIA